jgi:hypothetical protein
LIPIQPHVGSDQVVADILEHGVPCKGRERRRSTDDVLGERDGICERNSVIGAPGVQATLALLLQRVDGGHHLPDFLFVKNPFEAKESIVVELANVLRFQAPRSSRVGIAPSEAVTSGMRPQSVRFGHEKSSFVGLTNFCSVARWIQSTRVMLHPS